VLGCGVAFFYSGFFALVMALWGVRWAIDSLFEGSRAHRVEVLARRRFVLGGVGWLVGWGVYVLARGVGFLLGGALLCIFFCIFGVGVLAFILYFSWFYYCHRLLLGGRLVGLVAPGPDNGGEWAVIRPSIIYIELRGGISMCVGGVVVEWVIWGGCGGGMVWGVLYSWFLFFCYVVVYFFFFTIFGWLARLCVFWGCLGMDGIFFEGLGRGVLRRLWKVMGGWGPWWGFFFWGGFFFSMGR